MKGIFILPTQLKINTTSGVEELMLHGEGSFDALICVHTKTYMYKIHLFPLYTIQVGTN